MLPRLGYVTYQDIRGVSSFEEQTVIAIKAPPETRLEVPDPSQVKKSTLKTVPVVELLVEPMTHDVSAMYYINMWWINIPLLKHSIICKSKTTDWIASFKWCWEND